MIKGRYVALIEIDIHIADADTGFALPVDKIKQNVMDGTLTKLIQEEIADNFDDSITTVTVTQQYADVYEVNEE